MLNSTLWSYHDKKGQRSLNFLVCVCLIKEGDLNDIHLFFILTEQHYNEIILEETLTIAARRFFPKNVKS